MSNILVIGGGGYVGTPLCDSLAQDGHKVTSLDTFWYGNFHNKNIKTIKYNIIDSIREKPTLNLNDFDIAIFLASISNDPSAEISHAFTRLVNFEATKSFLKYVNTSRISRLIFASSSSVYGVSSEPNVTEMNPVAPLTLYSKLKVDIERFILNEINNTESVIVRPATVYGPSSRMRLDVIVNILCASAINNQKINVFGGQQFRPNIYIDDIIEFYKTLSCYPGSIDKEIFNIGAENLNVDEIASRIIEHFDGVEIAHIHTNDLRSYRINSSKAWDFFGIPPYTMNSSSIKNTIEYIRTINDRDSIKYINLKTIEHLIKSKKHLL